MIKSVSKIFFLFLVFYCYVIFPKHYDCAVVGFINPKDGIGQHAMFFNSALSYKNNNLSIGFVPTRLPFFIDVDYSKFNILKDGDSCSVSILADILYYPPIGKFLYQTSMNNSEKMPKSKIKYAFSVFETTEIPKKWVSLLNENFDGVLVPDQYLVNVYKKAGVNIPVFLLPEILFSDDFFSFEKKVSKNKSLKNKPFIFGSLGAFDPRKNYFAMIKSFIFVFGSRRDVVLRINGRSFGATNQEFLKIKWFIWNNNIKNIYITNETLSRKEYCKLMSSFDCYVNVSKGEGFSIAPREALAAEIPVILADNTAQSFICNTGHVCPVKCSSVSSAFYSAFDSVIGDFFEVDQDDLSKAFKKVFNNYELYKTKAKAGKQWVKFYKLENLEKYYKTLIKPKKIELTTFDRIDSDILYTSSKSLYEKYLSLKN